MSTKTNTIERNGHSKVQKLESPWTRALIAKSEWPDKVSFIKKLILIKLIKLKLILG